MIHDVYEPLALYRDQFKEEYAERTAAFFEELFKSSGVDEAANAATVEEIRGLEKEIANADSRRSKLKLLRIFIVILVVLAIAGVILFIVPIVLPDTELPFYVDGLWATVCAIVATAGVLFTVMKLNAIISTLSSALQGLKQRLDVKLKEAWGQLAPLNRLYDWGMFAGLIQKTVPRLALDPYFSHGRLDELRRSFHWKDNFNNDKSVLFAQSGEINGNPFVIAETLNFQMGTKSYSGSLSISWQESESYTDSEGRSRTRMVTRHETLRAHVVKPEPNYARDKFVIYGNEAAPKLTFSRAPSSLSADTNGVFNQWRMKHTVNKLEKFSRNLDDDSNYTIMSNRDFAARFHATDRSCEVQYRLLFTPLAQQQMVNLLRDKAVGFGDDFTFIKDQMVNIVWPAHLKNIDITAAPALFKNYDVAAARAFFNEYSNAYFRSFYFALAPLLTIPLYQQHRSHDDIYKEVYGKTASFWEHESIANFHGQAAFKHASSVTDNILKTHHTRTKDGGAEVSVTAHGFRGEKRVDYISQRGGDGRWHNVPVEWINYLPVQRTSSVTTREAEGLSLKEFEQQSHTSNEWQDFFRQGRVDPKRASFRRSIVSFINKS